MNPEVKRKQLLRNLAKQGDTQLMVDLQPRGAEHFYLTKENRARFSGRFPPSHLPFRRPNTALVSYHGSRIIGHIYGLNENVEIVINRNRHPPPLTSRSTNSIPSHSLEYKKPSGSLESNDTKE